VILPSRWRRNGVKALLGTAIVLVVVCARSTRTPVAGDDRERYHDRSFRVARVIDGDTLDVAVPDGNKPVTRIRLWGVDSPETGDGPKPLMHFGREAKAYAKETLTGQTVHVVLSPERTRGKYGRLLAYVFLKRGGRMFNEMLLEGGYAYADLRFPHHYSDRFTAIEKGARKDGRGLWAEVTLDKMPPWKQRFERASGQAGD
jgi:micrococcal nuclease